MASAASSTAFVPNNNAATASSRGCALSAVKNNKGFGGFGKVAKIPIPSKPPKAAKRELQEDRPCPCHSGKTFGECCHGYLTGEALVPSPEHLLRSRYSAFSLQDADYIVDTTHSTHSDYDGDNREAWKTRVLNGLDELRFVGLDIKAKKSGSSPDEHHIYFGVDVSVPTPGGGKRAQKSTITEISTFLREDGRWYYSGGIVNPTPDVWDES